MLGHETEESPLHTLTSVRVGVGEVGVRTRVTSGGLEILTFVLRIDLPVDTPSSHGTKPGMKQT